MDVDQRIGQLERRTRRLIAALTAVVMHGAGSVTVAATLTTILTTNDWPLTAPRVQL